MTTFADRLALDGANIRNVPRLLRSSGSAVFGLSRPTKPLNVPMQQSGTPIVMLNERVSFWPFADVMVTVTLKMPTRSGMPVTHPVAGS